MRLNAGGLGGNGHSPRHLADPSDGTVDTADSLAAPTHEAGAWLAPGARALPEGELLPGWTASRWQHLNFVLLGCFLTEVLSVFFWAPAFHPDVPAAEGKKLGILWLATLLPVIVLMTLSRLAISSKNKRELQHGYTTLRWVSTYLLEVRDSHGRVIPRGDKRLATSAKYMHMFFAVASACAVVSPAIWLLRLMIH